MATIEFDLRATLHVLKQPGVDLVLGHNTAILTLLQRASGRRVIINMDGIEWRRQKWGKAAKAWFWLNEWIGLKFVTVAIADHPKIAEHLSKRGRTGSVVIQYGSENIPGAPTEALDTLTVEPEGYFVSIARMEPENSILEMVRGFVAAKTGRKFVILGKLLPEANTYHASVLQAADEDVIFPGAIYDQSVVQALRVHCLAYIYTGIKSVEQIRR
ncbi:DUF1972 domain-containing protein [Rhizobium lemnae]|uniref:DUF1972 domain-containing protein n=1 Tax=Rhizobium lemnae TaxID=1214924 RepID=A0ABV8EEK1_9HYPH|nr:DUF1972 domain-containing protein [Rhizobium lemnae]MCJ8510590.1 DUF1972 domain-containing protein [Rhizobium lemnae]